MQLCSLDIGDAQGSEAGKASDVDVIGSSGTTGDSFVRRETGDADLSSSERAPETEADTPHECALDESHGPVLQQLQDAVWNRLVPMLEQHLNSPTKGQLEGLQGTESQFSARGSSENANANANAADDTGKQDDDVPLQGEMQAETRIETPSKSQEQQQEHTDTTVMKEDQQHIVQRAIKDEVAEGMRHATAAASTAAASAEQTARWTSTLARMVEDAKKKEQTIETLRAKLDKERRQRTAAANLVAQNVSPRTSTSNLSSVTSSATRRLGKLSSSVSERVRSFRSAR